MNASRSQTFGAETTPSTGACGSRRSEQFECCRSCVNIPVIAATGSQKANPQPPLLMKGRLLQTKKLSKSFRKEVARLLEKPYYEALTKEFARPTIREKTTTILKSLIEAYDGWRQQKRVRKPCCSAAYRGNPRNLLAARRWPLLKQRPTTHLGRVVDRLEEVCETVLFPYPSRFPCVPYTDFDESVRWVIQHPASDMPVRARIAAIIAKDPYRQHPATKASNLSKVAEVCLSGDSDALTLAVEEICTPSLMALAATNSACDLSVMKQLAASCVADHQVLAEIFCAVTALSDLLEIAVTAGAPPRGGLLPEQEIAKLVAAASTVELVNVLDAVHYGLDYPHNLDFQRFFESYMWAFANLDELTDDVIERFHAVDRLSGFPCRRVRAKPIVARILNYLLARFGEQINAWMIFDDLVGENGEEYPIGRTARVAASANHQDRNSSR